MNSSLRWNDKYNKIKNCKIQENELPRSKLARYRMNISDGRSKLTGY